VTEQAAGERRGGAWRLIGWGAAAALLVTPAIAMRFTDAVNWTVTDFVAAAILIGGLGIALEIMVRLTRRSAYRAVAAIVILAVFGLIWAELAVGVFGSPLAGS